MERKTLLNERDEFFDHIRRSQGPAEGSRRQQRQKRQERRFLRTWMRAMGCLLVTAGLFGLSLANCLAWTVTFPATLVLIAVASFLAGRLWEKQKKGRERP